MMTEPMTDERLNEIADGFRCARAMHERFGTGPEWSNLYAGEELLAEVQRLRAELAEAYNGMEAIRRE